MTTLVMAAILVFGIMAYRLAAGERPAQRRLPDHPGDRRSCPGASPETMASAVATPLERQFSTIAGIDSMTSTSALGADARSRSSSRSSATSTPPPRTCRRRSPRPRRCCRRACRRRPRYQKVNPADQPILYLALSSPTLPLYTVDEYAQTILAQRISTISGVAQVQVFGSQKYAVRVQLDPRALATRGIGIDEVADRRSPQPTSTCRPARCTASTRPFNVQATGQLTDAAAYRPLIVAYRNGSPVRLEELGRVIDSVQTDKVASWFNDDRAVVLAIQRQPGTNTVEVVDAIRKLLPTLPPQLPAAVNLDILYDRSVVDPRVGARRAVHPAAHHRPGGAGHLPLPAQRLGHDHPEPGPAAVDRRHLRGHVPARLHDRQPLADGAHPLRRLRRGRRHRHAREHRPPHGSGHGPHGGGAARAPARSASPSCR